MNFSFLLSFLTTLYYWIQMSFFSSLSTSPKIDGLTLSDGKRLEKYGFLGFFLINILLITQLVGRWIESGHFPLSSLYESLLFLSWGIITIYLILERTTKNHLIGIVIAPLILCLLGFTGFILPSELQITKPLVPALQSNWLFMHVSVMMISYAALLIGSILSITYLIIYNFLDSKQKQVSRKNGDFDLYPLTSDSGLKNSNLLLLFDNLSYRTLGFGFCFLTLGILSGAVWANETWGSYWSWDPKETWALITWLTFAIYLHTRLVYNWEGIKPAIISSIGFLFIWVCYLGVNLLGKGLHSYGFFK